MSTKKVILITGGSDGLGKVIAERLLNDNQVVILSPTKDKLRNVAKELGCDFMVADVSNYESLVNVVGEVIKKYGKIDCLINNAGLWIQGELADNDPEKIERVLRVNTLGTIWATKIVLEQMKIQKSGLVININSQGGLYAKEERSVYTASKWAITGFTKSIQPELAKYGIGVTQICPGGMKTEMFDKTGNIKDKTNFLDTIEVAKLIEFLLSLDPTTVLPEVGIKNIKN